MGTKHNEIGSRSPHPSQDREAVAIQGPLLGQREPHGHRTIRAAAYGDFIECLGKSRGLAGDTQFSKSVRGRH